MLRKELTCNNTVETNYFLKERIIWYNVTIPFLIKKIIWYLYPSMIILSKKVITKVDIL